MLTTNLCRNFPVTHVDLLHGVISSVQLRVVGSVHDIVPAPAAKERIRWMGHKALRL